MRAFLARVARLHSARNKLEQIIINLHLYIPKTNSAAPAATGQQPLRGDQHGDLHPVLADSAVSQAGQGL
jgi:hypothetical protein